MPWVLQAQQLMTWSACGAVCLLPSQQHQDWTEGRAARSLYGHVQQPIQTHTFQPLQSCYPEGLMKPLGENMDEEEANADLC